MRGGEEGKREWRGRGEAAGEAGGRGGRGGREGEAGEGEGGGGEGRKETLLNILQLQTTSS